MKYFLAALALCLAFSASADESIDCEEASSTADLNECAVQEMAAAEKVLAAYLEKAKEEYDFEKKVLAKLDKSQESWKKYSKDYCDSIYEVWSEGSIRGVMFGECMVRLTKERTHNIWTDYLVSMEGEAILPEPK